MKSRDVKILFESGFLLILTEKQLIDNIPAYLLGLAIKRGKEYMAADLEYMEQIEMQINVKAETPEVITGGF